MTAHLAGFGELPSAGASGRICAEAGKAARDLRDWVGRYDGLFSDAPFDATLLHSVSLVTAFSAPWLGSTDLRITNNAILWGFGVDWLVDYVAKSREEVADIVRRCLAVGQGAAPADGDDLARSLADIRAGLIRSPAFPALRDIWYDDLRRHLHAMAREWDWKAARTAGDTAHPTFEEYLDNTDNFGFSIVFVAHWIANCESARPTDIDEIMTASRETQRLLRLVNDQGTYERDLSWGDLNALMLGIGPEELRKHIGVLTDRLRELLAALRARHPGLAHYLERQVEFCVGFYEVGDYWGAL